MSLFTKAIPNTRPEINRRQTMIKWPQLVAMALCAAIFLPGPAPATPKLDSALETTVADSIVAIREGKISVKMSPSRRCMRRLKIRWYITASASSICLTAVRACRRVRNCPISTKRPRHTKDMLIPSSNWHSSMNEASAPRPTQTMRWPNTASPQARTISKRSIIWRFYCHAATM